MIAPSTDSDSVAGLLLPPYHQRFLHLAALWAFGVAQPMFSMISSNPEFLVVRGSSRLDVAVFASLLVLIPPFVVIGVEILVGLVWETLARALHVLAVWCSAFLVALQLWSQLEPGSTIALLVPFVPATLAVLAYLRWRASRSVLALASALPIIGAIHFIATVPLAVDDRAGVTIDITSTTPVVLVAFDEFPVSSLMRTDGSLNAVRYPNFARLANQSVWYPRATTVHASTTQAVPAILTGRVPRDGELPTLQDHPENLFTLLGEQYAIRASEQATRLCPSRYCPRIRPDVPLVDRERGLLYDASVAYLHGVLPGSLRGELPPIGQRWGGFGDSSDIDVRELVLGALDANALNVAFLQAQGRKSVQFQEFLGSIEPGRARTLYFEHALLPHSPWAFLPSGRRYGDAPPVEGIEDDWVRWRGSTSLVDQALQRHLLQVGYVDRLIGQLLDRLQTTGIYDRALLIVTADHGASFRARGYMREIERQGFADIAAIPLFVKYPGQREGQVDPRDAKTIDIVPTIADVISARIPWHVDGLSLRDAPKSRRVAVSGYETGQLAVVPTVVAREVLAIAARNARIFGEDNESIYRLGPHQKLLGQRLESLSIVDSAETGVHLDNANELSKVRKSSAVIPTRVTGWIDEAAAPERELAISINGQIAATTRSFVIDGRSRFAVLVPERTLRDGANLVAVFSIASAQGDARLTRLRLNAAKVPVQASDGQNDSP